VTVFIGELKGSDQTGTSMKKIVYGVLTGFLLIVAVFVFLNVFFSSLALITGSNRLRLSYLNRKYPIISSREIKPLDRCCI